jgi:hypothetical protein
MSKIIELLISKLLNLLIITLVAYFAFGYLASMMAQKNTENPLNAVFTSITSSLTAPITNWLQDKSDQLQGKGIYQKGEELPAQLLPGEPGYTDQNLNLA